MTQQGQSKVYRTQGATGIVVASGGTLSLDGGAADFTSGRVTMPGTLARGYASLTARGAKLTATASGITIALTTGTQPFLRTFELASGALVYGWTSAAGQGNPLYYEPWRVPNDLSTAAALLIYYTARASGEAATNQINVAVRAGTATADLGATGAVDYSATHAERSISVAASKVPTSGILNVSVFPTAASGTIRLFGLGLSYAKKTS